MRIATVLLFAVLPLSAQSVVVPNANATTTSTGVLNNPMRGLNAPRTYMMGINASELAAIPVGALITGISMRGGQTSNPTPWPAVNTTWSPYEVTVGNVIPTNAWSTTFMSNFVTAPIPPVLARGGPMVLEPNVFVSGSSPNAWGEFYWDFQTPFLYIGGDLGVLMTHPGSDNSTSIFFEQVASNPAIHGTAMTNAGTTAFRATTGSLNYVFCVVRIHYGYGSPTGCPGTNAMSPVLAQNGNITGGGTILLTSSNGIANNPVVFVLGFTQLQSPLPNGCLLLASPDATLFTLLNGLGRARLSIVVPPGITGQIYAQSLALDAGAPGGFSASNGVAPAAF